MNAEYDEETLVFSNEPITPSESTMTLSILRRENVLTGSEDSTAPTQKTIVEGRITFNPCGDRIFFIPPTESVQSELSLVPDRKKWDFYLVSLPFTLHELSGNRYYERLKFIVKLTTADAIAFVLFPRKVDNEVEATKTYCLSPTIQFQEFKGTKGQRGKRFRFEGLRPLITSFGEKEVPVAVCTRCLTMSNQSLNGSILSRPTRTSALACCASFVECRLVGRRPLWLGNWGDRSWVGRPLDMSN
jgi:hypothetical protein